MVNKVKSTFELKSTYLKENTNTVLYFCEIKTWHDINKKQIKLKIQDTTTQ